METFAWPSHSWTLAISASWESALVAADQSTGKVGEEDRTDRADTVLPEPPDATAPIGKTLAFASQMSFD